MSIDMSYRRAFVVSAVLYLAMMAPVVGRAEAPRTDLVVLNANVITIDDRQPRAEAFAVAHGRFIAIGTTDEIRAFTAAGTHVIDAMGKTITPGFIDAHMHPRPIFSSTSLLRIVDLSPANVATMEALIHALREKAKITPEGQWVRGNGYQDTKLGRHPSRADLDRASTNHPIQIRHSSGHIAVFNSFALRAAGIDEDTPDPAGGQFDRDRDGEPNGICREAPASSMVRNAGPPLPTPTHQEELAGLLRCFENFVSKGITSVGHAGTGPEMLRLYQDAYDAGQPVRVYVMLRERYLPQVKTLGLQTGFGNANLRLGSIKLFHGNSLSGRTCWLYEPYADRPEYYGIPPARSQEELDRLIYDIHASGFQAAVHANGDREIDMVLDAIERAVNRLPRPNHRHRIEHCSIVNPGILKRIKRLGVVLALHSYVYEHGDKMEAYGRHRWGMMHPNRTALDLGIRVAGNSDYGVSAADPMLRIQSMVTRRSAEGKVYGPEQRVTAEQAIGIWTLGSAYASFEEDIKGSIAVGKLADFVMLSDDPTQIVAGRIKDITVLKTIIGGRVVFDRSSPSRHPAATKETEGESE